MSNTTIRRVPNHDIYVMDRDASSLTAVVQVPADDFAPALSPDSHRIAFASIRSA